MKRHAFLMIRFFRVPKSEEKWTHAVVLDLLYDWLHEWNNTVHCSCGRLGYHYLLDSHGVKWPICNWLTSVEIWLKIFSFCKDSMNSKYEISESTLILLVIRIELDQISIFSILFFLRHFLCNLYIRTGIIIDLMTFYEQDTDSLNNRSVTVIDEHQVWVPFHTHLF
jgi:hypothetical protein